MHEVDNVFPRRHGAHRDSPRANVPQGLRGDLWRDRDIGPEAGRQCGDGLSLRNGDIIELAGTRMQFSNT